MSGKNQFSRREFIKDAAVVGASAVVAGLAANSVPSLAAAAPARAPEKWDYEADVVVAGAGLGGMTAALAAQKAGAKVVVVEANDQYGGTAVDSGGGVSCSILGQKDPVAAIPTLFPYGDPALLKVFIDNYPPAKQLLVGTGAPVTDTGPSSWSIGKEKTFASRMTFFDHVVKVFKDAGGTLLLSTKAIKLVTADTGLIQGLAARAKDGKVLNVKAKAVVLATGGYQNNPELKVKYFGRWGDTLINRSVPTNDGTGILMAQAVGAKMSKALGSFYGHTLPAPPAQLVYGQLAEWGSQYYDIYSIIVNLDGNRFFDEGAGIAGDPLNQQIVEQRYGRAVILFDQHVYDEYGEYEPVRPKGGIKRPLAVKEHGGKIASAPTIDELGKKLEAWGYNSQRLVQTFKEFNAAVEKGKAGELTPPKTESGALSKGCVIKLDQPPFWAVEIAGGVSICYGGLAINTKTEVLDQEDRPIPGLFAVPGTAGGITAVHYYNSSLGALSAFGYLAGTSAAKLKAAV